MLKRLLKLLLKLLLVFTLVIVTPIIAGVSGLTFYLWPTSVDDHPLQITPSVIAQLKALRAERKFDPDEANFYFGAKNEPDRVLAQIQVNAVIDVLLGNLQRAPHRAFVLSTFKDALSAFDTIESEERERFLYYLERIMDIVGVKSSGELFNVWIYGFPYGWFFSN